MFNRVSQFTFYSLGIVGKDKDRWSDEIQVYPSEELPFASGSIMSASYKTGGKNIITARWVPINQSNRMTPPDVVAGEKVMLYRFADTDEYYWNTLFREPDLRRLETVLYAFGNLKKKGKAFNKEDSSYYFEVSTHDGHIHLHTSRSNQEKVGYDIMISTRESHIIIKDTLDNMVKLDSAKADFDVKTNHDIQLRAANNINIMADNDFNFRCKGVFNLRVGKDWLYKVDNDIKGYAEKDMVFQAKEDIKMLAGKQMRLRGEEDFIAEGFKQAMITNTKSEWGKPPKGENSLIFQDNKISQHSSPNQIVTTTKITDNFVQTTIFHGETETENDARFLQNVDVSGNLSVQGDLSVGGSFSGAGGDFSLSPGQIQMNGNINATQNVSVGGEMSASTIRGSLVNN